MTEELDDRLNAIFQAVLDYKGELVAELVARELEYGTEAQTIINDALIAAMDEVGDQFATGRVFVPEMLTAANATKSGLAVLRPHMTGQAAKPVGKLVIGSVYRDLHDIGKNLVSMIMEAAAADANGDTSTWHRSRICEEPTGSARSRPNLDYPSECYRPAPGYRLIQINDRSDLDG
jgi:methanogenic corrinoid protein MtbC1